MRERPNVDAQKRNYVLSVNVKIANTRDEQSNCMKILNVKNESNQTLMRTNIVVLLRANLTKGCKNQMPSQQASLSLKNLKFYKDLKIQKYVVAKIFKNACRVNFKLQRDSLKKNVRRKSRSWRQKKHALSKRPLMIFLNTRVLLNGHWLKRKRKFVTCFKANGVQVPNVKKYLKSCCKNCAVNLKNW